MAVIEQWLSGRDFAKGDDLARQMINFTYMIGDEQTKRAWLVDPAWDVQGIHALVRARGFELDSVLLTHWHPDHAGGEFLGFEAEGAARLRELTGCAVRAHRAELPWLEQWSRLATGSVTPFDAGDELALGDTRLRCVHTPGHTPGSTCYLVEGALFTGDVLFVGAIGRTDLPGADPEEMDRTLHERLAVLPAETVVYPGHNYGSRRTSTLAEERRTNPYLK